MKKQFNIGDLVEGGFGNYGFGVIIQKKSYGTDCTSYRVHWAEPQYSTWETGRQIILVAKNAKV